MPFTNIISRTDSQALVPEQVSDDLLKDIVNDAAALTMFGRVPMSTNQTRMPILSALPTAYFVNGDTGLKQTTEANWANKYLNVEEIAGIIPIPEAVLDDTSYDVWGEVRPLVAQAIARTLDAAVFFGTNKPSSWPTAIASDAVTAGQTVVRGTNNAAAGGIYGDLSGLWSAVEGSGYDVNGLIATTTYKGFQRNARSTQGVKLDDAFAAEVAEVIKYPMRGLWPTPGTGAAEAIAGDFSQGLLGVRRDFTYKILDQAVITDNTGAIVFNLPQQDMVALRVVFRCAFQVANTINYDKTTDPTASITSGSRYPFAVLTHA